MSTPFTSPTFKATSFNCPLCNAFAKQQWYGISMSRHGGHQQLPDLSCCVCEHCNDYSLWRNGKMLYPESSNIPMPNSDMPAQIRADYEEARSIVVSSPRGAAALLRLSIQKLCAHLGEPGKDINTDIKSLVAKGLPPAVQQALDTVRVIGNEAVHPGELNLVDDVETASALFGLVNFIVDDRITKPKGIEALYALLPTSKRAGIDARDKK